MVILLKNSSNPFEAPEGTAYQHADQRSCQGIRNVIFPDSLQNYYYLSLGMIMIVIALLVIILNGIFLFITYKTKDLRTISNTLLITLSIVDFFTGMAVLPALSVCYIMLFKRTIFCYWFWYSEIIVVSVSVTSFSNIVLIACERYLAILHTFRHHRIIWKSKLYLSVLIMFIFWLCSSLLTHVLAPTLPRFFNIFWSLVACLFALMYVFVIFCYLRVYKEVRTVKKKISTQNTIPEIRRSNTKENYRSIKTTSLVILTFTLCYMPFCGSYLALSIARRFSLETTSKHLTSYALPLSQAVILLNSALNPVVYYFRLSSVRSVVRRLFWKVWLRNV